MMFCFTGYGREDAPDEPRVETEETRTMRAAVAMLVAADPTVGDYVASQSWAPVSRSEMRSRIEERGMEAVWDFIPHSLRPKPEAAPRRRRKRVPTVHACGHAIPHLASYAGEDGAALIHDLAQQMCRKCEEEKR